MPTDIYGFPSNRTRDDGVAAAEVNTMAEVLENLITRFGKLLGSGIFKTSFFNATAIGGELAVSLSPGVAYVGSGDAQKLVRIATTQTVTLAPNATNYLYVTVGETIEANTTGVAPTGAHLVCTVITDALEATAINNAPTGRINFGKVLTAGMRQIALGTTTVAVPVGKSKDIIVTHGDQVAFSVPLRLDIEAWPYRVRVREAAITDSGATNGSQFALRLDAFPIPLRGSVAGDTLATGDTLYQRLLLQLASEMSVECDSIRCLKEMAMKIPVSGLPEVEPMTQVSGECGVRTFLDTFISASQPVYGEVKWKGAVLVEGDRLGFPRALRVNWLANTVASASYMKPRDLRASWGATINMTTGYLQPKEIRGAWSATTRCGWQWGDTSKDPYLPPLNLRMAVYASGITIKTGYLYPRLFKCGVNGLVRCGPQGNQNEPPLELELA